MKHILFLLITLTLISWGEEDEVIYRSALISKVTAENADRKDIKFEVKAEQLSRREGLLMLQVTLKSDLHKKMSQRVGIYLYDKNQRYIGQMALYRSDEEERPDKKFKGTWYWCKARSEYLINSTLSVEYSSLSDKDNRWKYQLEIKKFVKFKAQSNKKTPNKDAHEEADTAHGK